MNAASTPLRDRFGRVPRKLRLSVTDRCNLRCPYCMPEAPTWRPREELLRFEELVALTRIFVDLGVRELRLTGGEPLLRRGLPELVARLDAELRPQGLERIALTTNGVRLADQAQALAEAGLDDLNVSLDGLRPQTFAAATGGGRVEPVLAGIEAAQAAGLPVKLNVVPIRGINEAELGELVVWARQRGLPVRFIEFMPLDGRGMWHPERVVTEAELREQLAARWPLADEPHDPASPARYVRLPDGYRIGFISTVSRPFCDGCDRLRLTADGRLVTCLFSDVGTDLRTPLRQGAAPAELRARIAAAVATKPRGYIEWAARNQRPAAQPMHVLGG